MKKFWALILVAPCLLTSACAGVKVDGPGDLKPGQTGTVTVTVSNDNTATPERSVTLTATVSYTEAGATKTASASSTFKVLAGPGVPWTGIIYRLPDSPDFTYEWGQATTSGGVNPRVDSAHVAAVDSLGPGESWTVKVPVTASK